MINAILLRSRMRRKSHVRFWSRVGRGDLPGLDNRMFEYMRMDGFLMKRRGAWNYPTQKAMNLRLFEIKKTIYLQGAKTLIVRSNVQVTGKGQIYFLNKFLAQKKADLLDERQIHFDNFGE